MSDSWAEGLLVEVFHLMNCNELLVGYVFPIAFQDLEQMCNLMYDLIVSVSVLYLIWLVNVKCAL